MIVWGGRASNGVLNTGGRYNPSNNTWAAVSTNGAPSARQNHTAIWTGSEMIVFGGYNSSNLAYFANGFRYNPSNDAWTALPASNSPSPRADHSAIWTGSNMIVWAGASNSVALGEKYLTNGARYWLTSNSWSPISITNAPFPRANHTAVWTGNQMIAWGGIVNDGATPYKGNSGGRYTPGTNGWTATTTSGAPTNRSEHTAVWIGSQMIVWGGLGNGALDYLNSGGRYTPSNNTWQATTTNNAPSIRQTHTAIWTGSEMIVWGGRAASNYRNNGGRYNPVSNAWTTVASTGAPAGRANHTAVWTGTEMIVWGGESTGGVLLNSMGRYTPSLDIWNIAPVCSLDSPAIGATVSGPTNTLLSATVSDPDGTVSKVEFYDGAVLIGTRTAGSSNVYTWPWTNPAPGAHTLTAVVYDNLNMKGTSPPVVVTVIGGPTVSLDTPAIGSVFGLAGTISLAATATSTGGTIANVQFYRGTNLLATDSTSPYAFAWSSLVSGAQTLTARATDNFGATTTSAPVSITITGPPTVSMTSPSNGTAFGSPATIALAANASSVGSIIAQVQFYEGANLLATSLTSPYGFTWANVPPGSYTLTARAMDLLGTTSTSAPVAITVAGLPTVSLTAPTNGAALAGPTNLALSATASSTGGSITQVQFFLGTTLLATDTNSPFSMTWSNVLPGSYTLTARATDSFSVSSTSAPISVTIVGPPAVSLTAPTNGAALSGPADVTLTANAGSVGGSIMQIQYFQGTTLLGTDTNNPATITWSNAAAGSYTLTARATDNFGVTSTSAPVSITIVGAPVVLLTSPANGVTIAGPTDIALAANASSPGGTIAQLQFFQGTTLLASDAAAPYAYMWTGVAPGSYTFTARATDNLDTTTTSAPVTINVVGPPTVSVSSPTNNTFISGPADVLLTAEANSIGGIISQVQFFAGTTALATNTNSPFDFIWTNVAPGTYSLTAQATDNLGVSATSAPVTLTVVGAPTVSLLSPTDGVVIAGPGAISFSANASSIGATITQIEFFQGAIPLATNTNSFAGFVWTNVGSGVYTLRAKAMDTFGMAATSAPVTVTVTLPPVVSLDSPVPSTIIAEGSDVLLTSSAIDPDGNVAQVDFFVNNSMIASALDAPYSATWTNVPHGIYTLTSAARDNNGIASTSAPVSILVNALPLVSVTAPLDTTQVIANGQLDLAATASDIDGSVAQVEFFVDGSSICLTNAAPFVIPWTNKGLGFFTLTAVATDDRGMGRTSAPVTIESVLRPQLDVTRQAGKLFLQLSGGETGRYYRIDASTNFTSWIPIRTNLATNGSFTIFETFAPAQNRRFYRAVP